MILVDTSVWIDHLRRADAKLVDLLNREEVITHPFILGELACGNIGNRRELLSLFSRLPVAPGATDAEALSFIEQRKLMGRGIGYIDVHLLAAAELSSETRLWTRDERLGRVAFDLKLRYMEG